MLIRAARDPDAEAVATIHHRGWTGAYRGLVPDAYLGRLSEEECLARWRSGFGGATTTFVAEESGRVVGFVSVGPSADPDARAAGEIWDLWVLPDYRSSGVGAALLRHGLTRLAETYRAAIVWVLAGNERARTFYVRHGGVRDGVTRTQHVAGGSITDVRYLFDLRGFTATQE